MANYNKVIFAGNLTRDPQLSYTPSKTPVCEFGIAINRKWTTPNGDKREEVCFVDCVCFGKQAEVFNQYMEKGKPILIEGRLKLDQWESKEGQKRSKHSIVVESFQFMGGSDGEKRGGSERQSGTVAFTKEADGGDVIDGDDVPF